MAADAVTLNVGGTEYITSVATLTRFPYSRLGLLVSQSHGRRHFTFDRDGPLFRHILSYLRNNALILPDGFTEMEALRAEANFYNLQSLVDVIDQLALNVRERTILRLEERVFIQSGQFRRGTFTDWTVRSGDPSVILWLSEVGVFVANQANVTIADNGTTLYWCWHNGISVVRNAHYVASYGEPQPVIHRADVLEEIRSHGYQLTNISPIVTPPHIDLVLRAFVHQQSARLLEFQLP